jgi:hypothetical protein
MTVLFEACPFGRLRRLVNVPFRSTSIFWPSHWDDGNKGSSCRSEAGAVGIGLSQAVAPISLGWLPGDDKGSRLKMDVSTLEVLIFQKLRCPI